MTHDLPGGRPPPGRLPRGVVATLLVVGVVVPSLVIRESVQASLGPGPLADLGWIAIPMAATAWLAPRVSYRRRDALLWLLVAPGMYVFTVIAWRLAYLPYRDWPPRPDEARGRHPVRTRGV